MNTGTGPGLSEHDVGRDLGRRASRPTHRDTDRGHRAARSPSAVCTDWVLPQRVLHEAALSRDIVVGPFLPFGYRSRPGSGGGQHFPGTVSLRATTFMSVLEDVLSELNVAASATSCCTTGTTRTAGSSTSPLSSCRTQSRTQDRGRRGCLPEIHPRKERGQSGRTAFRPCARTRGGDRDVAVDASRRICAAE